MIDKVCDTCKYGMPMTDSTGEEYIWCDLIGLEYTADSFCEHYVSKEDANE